MATGLSTFPRVSVASGERRFASIDANANTSPTLRVEVTSKATDDYDRGESSITTTNAPPSMQYYQLARRRLRRGRLRADTSGAGFTGTFTFPRPCCGAAEAAALVRSDANVAFR